MNETEIDDLMQRAKSGDQSAINDLLEHFRPRLQKMIGVRLNARLRSRVDESDVMQDAYLEAAKRLDDYLQQPRAPLFLWLRQITSQKIIDIHRRHLGAQARDAGMEVSLNRGPMPMASSVCLAAEILGQLTSPSRAVMREEVRAALQEALNGMDDHDREILSLRHFEELSNREAASELDIEPAAASKRYVRALQRLQQILSELGIVG